MPEELVQSLWYLASHSGTIISYDVIITMSRKSRQYDVAILGDTGFTAAFVAQIMATRFPTETRWLIAARSPTKLAQLRDRPGQLNPKKSVPGMSIFPKTL